MNVVISVTILVVIGVLSGFGLVQAVRKIDAPDRKLRNALTELAYQQASAVIRG